MFNPITIPFGAVMLYNVVKLKPGVSTDDVEMAIGEMCNLVAEFAVADAALRVRDRAVIDDCRLVTTPRLDVAVDGVVARVELAAGKPSIDRYVGIVQHAIPALFPVDTFRRFGPEFRRVLDRTPVNVRIFAHDSPAISESLQF